ncbi:MAG: Esa1p-associated factor [Alectoria sarmentosa]|nr:MAG: Esa1p-associated factor [Alectoria sarmentosa]
MAPVSQPTFSKDEKVLCFHHELLYEAKVLDSKHTDEKDKKSPMQYRVHYKGWKNTWDDWVPEDRLRKLNEENKGLATHLRNEFMALQRPAKPSISAASKKKTAGSDLSSTRGSEERHASLPATGRDQRRSSSRKRRKTSKAESPPSPPLKKTRGETKADPSPIRAKTKGKRKATIPPPETEKSARPYPPAEETAERKATPQPDSPDKAYVLPEESSFCKRFSLDASKLKPSRPRIAQQKPTVEHDSDDSPLSSIRSSAQDLGPGDTTGRKRGSVACQNGRKERAEARHAREIEEIRPGGALLALYKDQPSGTRITVAGIPLDETPADLVSFVKKKRQRVKTIDNKIKFTDKPPLQQEETFNLRPAIHINVPDHLKSILVDDWENVTKNLSLVPLPSKPSANEILTSYFDEEKNKRHLGSPEADLLEEVVAGLKEYFEKCVGRILLYRFERQQYLEVYNAVQAGTGEYEGKGMGDIYGAEHLCRLFVSLPELIAQTNMDQQSVNRLREELHKLTQWLGKNSTRFFKAPYETASQDYIEKVRGV